VWVWSELGGDLREGLGLRAGGREWKDDLDVVVIACGRVGKRERERKEGRAGRERRRVPSPFALSLCSGVLTLFFSLKMHYDEKRIDYWILKRNKKQKRTEKRETKRN